MRVWFFVVLCGLLYASVDVNGQEKDKKRVDDLSVLKSESGTEPPSKMLYTFLRAQSQKHFDARRETVAALKSPEDLQRRQKELKARFIESLGGFPERTPLNPQVVGKAQRDGYHIEKVIYESRPNHHITAVLYLPDSQPPFPGVLVPCGHSANGKAAEAYQRACILMAKNGLAVLCYDPIGQGERIQLLGSNGKPAIAGSTSEHTMVGVGALLVGRQTASYRIWDGIRSLDYLAGRPEIDPKRLGCTGNSGGGTLTAYLMALDDRIAAAAPSCYITTLERLFATIGPQDAEQNITGQVAFGMEHADYVTMRAPKPTLICVGTRDFFDITGAWTTFREAKLVYGMIGHGERVDLFEYNDPHGFSKPRREAAMRWLRRWLLEKDDAPIENDFPIFKDEELQCTRTGQVLEDFKGKSVFDFNQERNTELAAKRRPPNLYELRALLGISEKISPATRKQVGEEPREGFVIRKLVFDTEPGIMVPALQFEPLKPNQARPFIIYVSGTGKSGDAARAAIEKLVASGERVLALDLRGIGETAPSKPAANRPNFFGTDSREAFLGLHLNRPLLGQRVRDLISVVSQLRMQDSGLDIHAIGIGTGGPIVLHAAALEPAIKSVTLEESVVSWSAVVQSRISHDQLANAVPGTLQLYDLPNLAATIAPRPLMIRHAVDPVQKPVTQATLEATYASCRDAYQRLKAEGQLTLRQQ